MQGFRVQGKEIEFLNNVIEKNWRVYREENDREARKLQGLIRVF